MSAVLGMLRDANDGEVPPPQYLKAPCRILNLSNNSEGVLIMPANEEITGIIPPAPVPPMPVKIDDIALGFFEK